MTRLQTVSWLVLIGGSVLTIGGLPLALFLVVVGCLAFYEVQQMTELKSRWLMVLNMVAYSACILFFWAAVWGNYWLRKWMKVYFSFFTLKNPIIFWLTIGTIGCVFLVFIIEYARKSLMFWSHLLSNNVKYFLYITLGFWSVFFVRSQPYPLDFFPVFFMFMVIWATDVFAYYGGRLFGKRPLSPISSKKTIEGTVVGIALAMCIGFIFGLYAVKPLFIAFAILAVVAGAIGAIAQFGDLYESLIKRTYNVKDSSNLLPGHGGILDRADSTLFVAPMIVLLMLLLDFR